MEQNPILHTTLSLDSDIPLYAQLVGIIKRNISTGVLAVGALLPSEAELCRCLSISRNTVRQAIGELEDEGLVVSRAGAKSYVQASPQQIAALRRALRETEMQAMVDAARRMGLTREDAHRLLDTLYDREGTDA